MVEPQKPTDANMVAMEGGEGAKPEEEEGCHFCRCEWGVETGALQPSPPTGVGGSCGGVVNTQAPAHPPTRRWLIYIVTAPFLLFLWLLGAVLWLILLPFKCCCPCLGVPLGVVTKLVMRLLRLPFRCLRWIAGSPWEDTEDEEEKKEREEEARKGKK